MSLSSETLASFSFTVPIGYWSLAFILCLYPGLIYLSFLPVLSVALYRKPVFPILWSLFVVAAFLLGQELLSPLLRFHHLQPAVLSSQNPALAIGKKDI